MVMDGGHARCYYLQHICFALSTLLSRLERLLQCLVRSVGILVARHGLLPQSGLFLFAVRGNVSFRSFVGSGQKVKIQATVWRRRVAANKERPHLS